MILYATKKTMERYRLPYPDELPPGMIYDIVQEIITKEKGDRLLEWGAKLFYFNRKKCIQVSNFASQFTLFLIDVKVKDLSDLGSWIGNYLLALYEKDPPMISALHRMFEASPEFCFDKLTDKHVIATMNHVQTYYALDGARFCEYLKDGILHTVDFNREVNFVWLFGRKINGKKDYVYAGEVFRELVMARYGNIVPFRRE